MRREDEIEDRLEWAEEMVEQREDQDRPTRYFEGYKSALEWALTDDEMEERFGKRIESCPVKGADCDEGPFYGLMLLAHMKEEHPDAYEGVTKDGVTADG